MSGVVRLDGVVREVGRVDLRDGVGRVLYLPYAGHGRGGAGVLGKREVGIVDVRGEVGAAVGHLAAGYVAELEGAVEAGDGRQVGGLLSL